MSSCFMSGNRGENRFSVTHFGKGECICNLGGPEVIFSELANFKLI